MRTVQRLLDRQASRTGETVPVTGQYDRATQTAIEAFQHRVLRLPHTTGVVGPHDATLRQLNFTAGQRQMAGAPGGLRLPPRVGDSVLTEEDFQSAANDGQHDVRHGLQRRRARHQERPVRNGQKVLRPGESSHKGQDQGHIKITFWTDENQADAICTLSFKGWLSAWTISSGGGSNHVLSISIQPALDQQNYHNLTLGN